MTSSAVSICKFFKKKSINYCQSSLFLDIISIEKAINSLIFQDIKTLELLNMNDLDPI